MQEYSQLPTVSVVIPVYNALATLGRTLEAVYAQTYPNIIEVIVADDGSTEDTGAFLSQNFPQVRFVPLEHTGSCGAARNQGVARATGDFLAFVDADDIWFPEKIDRQMEVIAQQPDVAFVTTRYNRVTVGGEITPPPPLDQAPVFRLDVRRWLLPRYGHRIGLLGFSSGWLIRRALFNQLGGFDPNRLFMEDSEFLVRAMLGGHPVAVITDPLYEYLISPGGLSLTVGAQNPGGMEASMIARLFDLRQLVQARHGPLTEAEYELLVFKGASTYAGSLLLRGLPKQADYLIQQALQCRVGLWRKLWLRPSVALFALSRRLLGRSLAPVLARLRKMP
jgi:glycosyltransferase involved in cell wall biosynthesis